VGRGPSVIREAGVGPKGDGRLRGANPGGCDRVRGVRAQSWEGGERARDPGKKPCGDLVQRDGLDPRSLKILWLTLKMRNCQ